LEYVRRYFKGQTRSEIRGKVGTDSSSKQDRPLAGARVFVESATQKLVAVTDAEGKYDVEVAPGKYRIHASLSGFGLHRTQKPHDSFSDVEVANRGCVEQDVKLYAQNSVEGIITALSSPVELATVTLEPVEFGAGAWTFSAAAGRFRFTNVSPGRYRIVAKTGDPSPFGSLPHWQGYYRNSSSIDLARVIEVGPTSRVTGIRITLQPPIAK
jgi:hypothetical protein